MSSPVWILGVGMTVFGRHGELDAATLAADAAREALTDAHIPISSVQAAFYGSAAQGTLEGQIMIAGQIALRRIGLERAPVFNVENACATGAAALHLAVNHVRAGAAGIALAIGVEKMTGSPREDTMRVFDGAYDVSAPDEMRRTIAVLGGESFDPGTGDRSVFMDIYAAMARAHQVKFGTTQRQIAAVAAKNHRHAADNRRAYYRTPMTVDEVLAARALSYPLTVPMCSPITDGAAAAVVCSEQVVRQIGRGSAVRVLASVTGTGEQRSLSDYGRHISRLTAERAYTQAAVGPGDVSFAEVHDATAFAEILQTEMLGLTEPGEGGVAAESGATSLGGRIPVNPSGGLESKGHPLGATGLGQIHELVTQLRGAAGSRQVPNARVAIAENGGGFLGGEEAVTAITILGV